MPDTDTKDVKDTKLDNFCETYRVPMIRELVHVGDGNSAFGPPLCPRIHQLGGEGCICKGEVEAAKAKPNVDPVAKTASPNSSPAPALQSSKPAV